MTLTLLSIFTSLILFFSASGLVPKKIDMPFLLRCFVGTNLCSLILIPILYLNAKMINIIIPLLALFGLLNAIRFNFFRLKIIRSRARNFKQSLKIISIFVVVNLLVSISFIDYFPTNYIYNSHDLLYWSWTTNFHVIDYSGTMQSEIAWPLTFSSYHLLPGMFLGYLNYFNPLQNLSMIMLLKFLVITFTFSAIITDVICKHPRKFLRLAISFALPLLLFRNEISYNLLVSNYLATLLIFIIFWAMFVYKLKDKDLLIAILFLVLSFSKFIVFPIGLMLSLMFYSRSASKIPRFSRLLVLVIFTSNLFVWLFIQKPSDSASISIFNPFQANYFISFLKYVDWVNDPILNLILKGNIKYIIASFILALYISKIFLLFAFALKKVDTYRFSNIKESERKLYLIVSISFVLYSIFGYVFFRFDSFDIKHSAHLLYLASLFTFIFTGFYLFKLNLSHRNLGFLSILILLIGLFTPYAITDGDSLISPMRKLEDGYIQNMTITGARFVQSNSISTHSQLQLRASIMGTRLRCSSLKEDTINSPIYLFLYKKNGDLC